MSDLTPSQKLLWLFHVSSLPTGVSRGYVIDHLDIDERTLRRMVAKLRDLPFLEVTEEQPRIAVKVRR